MAEITLKGNKIHTSGSLPPAGYPAPAFTLTSTKFEDISLSDFKGRRVILNIFLSLDTSVCAASVRKFNKEVAELENTEVICVSADLPFAHDRFCSSEGLNNVINASVFRSTDFSRDYGVQIVEGPMRGLMSRAIIVIDTDGKVIYTQQVREISNEPDYDAAIEAATSDRHN